MKVNNTMYSEKLRKHLVLLNTVDILVNNTRKYDKS